MNSKEVITIRTFIKEAYPYSKLESDTGDDVWFVLLKEYKFATVYETLIEYIKNGNKFAPSIAELIHLSKDKDTLKLNEVVAYMEEKGYFDDEEVLSAEAAMWNKENRLRKTMSYIERGIVPEWLQKDINKYYREMNPLKLGDEKKQIGN